MLAALCVSLGLFLTQAPKGVALPDTPQGKHVEAFITAFNTGDQKKFLQAEEDHMAKTALDRRPAQERAQMFTRMRDDFGTFQVQKVVKATAQQIKVLIPTKEGDDATFTFDFEAQAPFRIAGIGVDIQSKGGE